jgi:hypothetical protein
MEAGVTKTYGVLLCKTPCSKNGMDGRQEAGCFYCGSLRRRRKLRRRETAWMPGMEAGVTKTYGVLLCKTPCSKNGMDARQGGRLFLLREFAPPAQTPEARNGMDAVSRPRKG